MNKIEFQNKIDALSEKKGMWNILVNQKSLGQFTLGYYLDINLGLYIVYEVDERQHFIKWGEFDNEDRAIDDLYDLIKYRLWID